MTDLLNKQIPCPQCGENTIPDSVNPIDKMDVCSDCRALNDLNQEELERLVDKTLADAGFIKK